MMKLILGGLLIIWGALVLYASLFKMNRTEDYKDKATVGANGYIEWDLLFKVVNRLPIGLAKSFILILGVSFIVLGALII